MSRRIIPQKLADINKHRVRKNIINSTLAGKKLINQTFNLISTIKVANKELAKLNIIYLKDTEIVYFSPEKIILRSKKEILRSKIKELHSQFLETLREVKLFSKLKTIEIHITYPSRSNNNIQKNSNSKTKQMLDKLKEDISLI